MKWQPIETAPKDGMRVLLYDPKCDVAISGLWHDDPGKNTPDGYEPAWSWWVADDDLLLWDDGTAPTHWMPLPPPPTEDA